MKLLGIGSRTTVCPVIASIAVFVSFSQVWLLVTWLCVDVLVLLAGC